MKAGERIAQPCAPLASGCEADNARLSVPGPTCRSGGPLLTYAPFPGWFFNGTSCVAEGPGVRESAIRCFFDPTMRTDMEFFMEFAVLAEGNLAPQPSFSEAMGPMIPYFMVIAGLFYFMILRPQTRERRQRELQLASLKRNDRVVTYSGIIGTITGFSDDNKEVTLRVDDNVKLRFLRSAIQGPLAEVSAAAETPKPGAS